MGSSPDLLVGFETSDDAAVYRLGPDSAMLLTADFFTPIVDDPRDFGRVAAANALSDIYAMGGRPLACLNLLALPSSLSADVAVAILSGGAEVVGEAGAVVVGGHSIEDAEPKYGMAVLGSAHPDAIVRNVGARPGDALVLTKPLGVGIMTTALKRGLETEESVRPIIESMARLNRRAAEAMLAAGANAATDVTGFGLVGHLREMLAGSGMEATIDRAAVPVWEGALAYAEDHVCPGRTRDLLEYLAPYLDWDDVGPEWRSVLTDPQTSGGLLVSLPAARAAGLTAALEAGGDVGAIIGLVSEGEAGRVRVR